MSFNYHIKDSSFQLSPATQANYQVRDESINDQLSQQELLKSYESVMQGFSYAKVNLSKVSSLKLQQHKITILSNIQQSDRQYRAIKNAKDFIFSIVQTQFYGLQYIYEIIVSNFKLRISILNLQRQSDTGEDDVDSKEVGTGSFGVVRGLKVNGRQYAVKRIPFQYKLQSEEGYDYQVNKREHLQLREALKQFCYFKIFSALGIGPKIVKTNYDLICFNNCIQFKMELCEPLVYKLSNKQQQFNFLECKDQLFQKLAMLHSINFVHRDIKPQNILYDVNEKSFVFGDFGLVSFVKGRFNQKTQTRFAGTPNYCGEQMSKLLNGGLGLVNLYHNDLICLQKTFNAIKEYTVSHNSRISENSLSCNDYASNFQSEANSFQSSERQAVSDANFTDETYFPTRNSVITIPTANTLAPKKYASSINHYQSQIIYKICREKQRRKYIYRDYLIQLIEQRQKQHNNDEISLTLLIELQRNFKVEDPDSEIINTLNQWKSSSRHFGPQHIRTIEKLKILTQITDKKSTLKLQTIISRLSLFLSSSKQNRLEVIIMKSLHNIQNLIYCFISYLKSLITQSLHNKQAILENDCIFVSQEFISIMMNQKRETYLVKQIQNLVRKIFKIPKINKQTGILQALKFALNYLRSKNAATSLDIIAYLMFLQGYPNWSSQQWDNIYGQIVKQINQLLINLQQHSEQIKINLICLLLKLSQGSKRNSEKRLIYKMHLQKASQIIDKELNCSDNSFGQKYNLPLMCERIEILYQMGDYDQTLKQGYAIQVLLHKQTDQMRKAKTFVNLYLILGQTQFKLKNAEKAREYFNKALKIFQQRGYTLTSPQTTFTILNNLAVTYKNLQLDQKYDQTLQQIADFLEKCTFSKKYQKLTYILQLQFIKLQQQGLKSQQLKQNAVRLAQKIINSFYNFIFKEGGSKIYLHHKLNYHLVNVSKCSEVDKYFILQAVVNHIRSKPQYLQTFNYQYSFSNLQLAMYYRQLPNKNFESMKYVWRGLKVQLQRYHPCYLYKICYVSVNVYVMCLIRAKSNRLAIRFLNIILKYIPERYQDIRYRTFKLMYRALKAIGNNKENLFYQLTKNNCQRLRHHSFITLPQKLCKQPRFRALQLKYAKKICYYQFTQFQ